MEKQTGAPDTAPAYQLPEGWPAASIKDIERALCAPGARFEMETVDIRGVPTRVWKNALPALPELARHARTHGDRLFTIYEDERVTYDAWFRATAILAAELAERGVTWEADVARLSGLPYARVGPAPRVRVTRPGGDDAHSSRDSTPSWNAGEEGAVGRTASAQIAMARPSKFAAA